MNQKPIPKSVVLGLIHALAAMPQGQVIECGPSFPELGYAPTVNKHVAKRQKKKRQRYQAGALAAKQNRKAHKDRNKKGRP